MLEWARGSGGEGARGSGGEGARGRCWNGLGEGLGNQSGCKQVPREFPHEVSVKLLTFSCYYSVIVWVMVN